MPKTCLLPKTTKVSIPSADKAIMTPKAPEYCSNKKCPHRGAKLSPEQFKWIPSTKRWTKMCSFCREKVKRKAKARREADPVGVKIIHDRSRNKLKERHLEQLKDHYNYHLHQKQYSESLPDPPVRCSNGRKCKAEILEFKWRPKCKRWTKLCKSCREKQGVYNRNHLRVKSSNT